MSDKNLERVAALAVKQGNKEMMKLVLDLMEKESYSSFSSHLYHAPPLIKKQQQPVETKKTSKKKG